MVSVTIDGNCPVVATEQPQCHLLLSVAPWLNHGPSLLDTENETQRRTTSSFGCCGIRAGSFRWHRVALCRWRPFVPLTALAVKTGRQHPQFCRNPDAAIALTFADTVSNRCMSHAEITRRRALAPTSNTSQASRRVLALPSAGLHVGDQDLRRGPPAACASPS